MSTSLPASELLPAPELTGSELTGSLLARCRFPAPGTPVVCAVSGGADSTALLLLALAAGCSPSVIHVDHGLRPDSVADADAVRRLGERLGVEVEVARVDVGTGANVEARAREARYSVMPAGTMLGHTADDQAETMLINLLRGSGPAGMAGMADDGRRPLLGLRRAETEALCAVSGIQPVHDPMNDDPRFVRSRVRRELLPLLASIGDRDPVPVLVRQAELFGELAGWASAQAGELDAADAKAVTAAPIALARTAVRCWIRDQVAARTGTSLPVDLAAVDRVLAVAAGQVRAAEVPGGWRVSRHGQRLTLSPATGPPSR